MSKLRILRMLSASLFGSMLLFGASVLASAEEGIPASATGGGSVAEQKANQAKKIGENVIEGAKPADTSAGQKIQTMGAVPDFAANLQSTENAAKIIGAELEKNYKQVDNAMQRLNEARASLKELQAKKDAAKEAYEKCKSVIENSGSNGTSCNLQQMKDESDAQQAAYDKAKAANEDAAKQLDDTKTDIAKREKNKDDLDQQTSDLASACMSVGRCYQDPNTGEIRTRSLMPANPSFSDLGCGSAGICTDTPLYSNSPSSNNTLGTPTGSPSSPPAPIDNGTSGYTGSLDPGSSQSYVPDSYAPSTAPAKVSGGGGATSSATPNAAASSSANNNGSSSNSGSGSGGSSGSSPAASGSGGSSASNPFAPIATAAGVTSSTPLSVNNSADSNETYCRVNPTGPNCPSTIQPAVKASQAKVNDGDYSGGSGTTSKTPFDAIANQALPKQVGDPGQLPQNQNTLGLPTAGNNAGDTAGRPGLATNNARSAALKAAMAGGSGFYGGSNGAISANSTSRSAAGHVPHTFGSRFGNSAMKLASTSVVGSQLNAQMGQSISRFPASMSPEVGKDGFTGPHTDLWRKVRNRYYDQSGSLNP